MLELPICSSCSNNEETIEHLFWECTTTQLVIRNLSPTNTFHFLNKKYILYYTASKIDSCTHGTVNILNRTRSILDCTRATLCNK